MDDKKKKRTTGASTNEVFIKDQVLTMQGNKVIKRRPRKKGEGKDNSNDYFKNYWSNQNK